METPNVRCLDLMPEFPLCQDAAAAALEIYADGIAVIERINQNCRMTYFTWVARPDGLVQRMPVVKITRPIDSLVSASHRMGASGLLASARISH